MKKIFKDILKLLVFVFLVNFLWEISQMFLYRDHTTNFWDFISVHIKASLGDVIIFFIIYLLGALIFQNKKWFLEKNIYKYFIASFLGFALAILIERYALITNRWAYNDLMPIIPILNVGLSPILQMIFLPLVTILFAKKYQ